MRFYLFLRKTQRPKGTYLQPVASYWRSGQGNARQRSAEAGYVESFIAEDVGDPISLFARKSIQNEAARSEKTKRSAALMSETLEREIGCFASEAGIQQTQPYLKLLQPTRNFAFQIADLLPAPIYAESLIPVEKRTLTEMIPVLFESALSRMTKCWMV